MVLIDAVTNAHYTAAFSTDGKRGSKSFDAMYTTMQTNIFLRVRTGVGI